MKEFASFLLSALLVLSLAACGSNGWHPEHRFRKQRRQHGFLLRSRVLCDLTTWNEITKSDTVTLEF